MLDDHRAALTFRALTLAAAGLLLILKAALTMASYRRVSRLLPSPAGRPAPGWVKTRTARAIHKASHWIPDATCLPQALAGSVLLSLQGYGSTVRIGVAPAADQPFRAHAWLMCGEDVIVGDGEDLSAFQPLTDIRTAGE